MKVSRAAARDDGDRGAGAAAVLGLEVRGLHAHLGDRIERRRGEVAGVLPGVLVGDAVVREVERRPAVDGEVVHALPSRSFTVARIDDARKQLEQAGWIAPLEGDVVHRLARDDSGPRAVRGLHLYRLGLYGDGLRHAADVERNRPQGDPFRRPQDDALLLVGLESLHGEGQVERTRQQVGENKPAVGSGHGFAGQAGADVLDGHGDARQYAAGGVGDGPGDLPGESLRLNQARNTKHHDRKRERDAGKTHFHDSSSLY